MEKGLISFVIPVYNEAENLKKLLDGIKSSVGSFETVSATKSLVQKYEIVLIDDGSTDNSWNIINSISGVSDNNIKGLRFRLKCGKAKALAAGFQLARGEMVFTMDSNLEDDPEDIPKFIEKLNEGNDLVVGLRSNNDLSLFSQLNIKAFSWVSSVLLGFSNKSHYSSMRCFKTHVVRELGLYGELHSMIPALVRMKGFKASEVSVNTSGKTKEDLNQNFKSMADSVSLAFLKAYKEKPFHLIGGMSIFLLISGFATLIFCYIQSGFFGQEVGFLKELAIICISASIPLFAVGLLSELVISCNENTGKNFPVVDTTENLLLENSGDISAETLLQAKDGKKAMVVDDDPEVRKLLGLQLKKIGLEVSQAENGAEALEKLTSDTSIMILDLMMPKKDGLGVLDALRERNANVQVIMVSSSNQVNQAVQAMKNGAFDYLQKPFSLNDLNDVVVRALKVKELGIGHNQTH